MSSSTPRRTLPLPEIGTRFGQRVVVGFPPPSKNGTKRVTMKCDCGRIDDTNLTRVLDGSAPRCMPCSKKRDSSTLPPIGTRYGKRVIIGYVSGGHQKTITAIVCCDCGDQAKAHLHDLEAGRLTQCIHCWIQGNLENLHEKTREKNRLRDRSNDHTKQPEYACWCAMWSRCRNPNDPAYPRYGGRGIKVTPEWADFQIFLRDMGRRPSKNHTIERKNTDSDYDLQNAKWGDWFEQQNNKRTNIYLTHNGKRMTISQWSRETGINYTTIRERKARGWSDEKILTTPVQPRDYPTKEDRS